jgi:AraC-like DNA-binding protein
MALVLALLVQGAGFVALRRPEWLARPYATPPHTTLPHAMPPDDTTSPHAPLPDAPRYAKSGLTAERLARYRERLVEVMQRDKPYLDENLRLADLARAAGIPPAHLSHVLSQEIGESFFDFVNSYRIEQVKRGFVDASNRRSVLEIALSAGFSSKSSFNRLFKQRTGVTPSEWIAMNAPSVTPTAPRDHSRRPAAPSVGPNPGSSPLG